MNKSQLDDLATRVLDCAFDVHRGLGPGSLENAYETAFCYELSTRGIRFERQKEIAVLYKGVRLDCGYRLDLFVENQIVLELKSCDEFHPIHEATLLNYLKLADARLGYLINFNVRLLKHGIKRVVNGSLTTETNLTVR
jgi:GxxExxY protein